MNSSRDSYTDPAVLLLHEIEQFVDKFAALERCLEQADEKSRTTISRLQEALAQLDRLRRSNEAEIAGLRRQVAGRESALLGHHPELGAVEGATREEECGMTMDDKDEPLAPSASTIGAASDTALEQSLRNEIERLVREGQERNRILQDRNDELVRVKAELDHIREQLNELESSRPQVENALRNDSARMRTEFQAQVALLQAELSQKEWTLEESQAKARGQEQNLREEIESLRQQLSGRKIGRAQDDDHFSLDPPAAEIAPGSDKQVGVYPGSFAQSRRWQSGPSSKRRWRWRSS
jgi:chromosome segregation ATPase